MRRPVFYGWWIVAACLTIATLSWGLGIFGVSVYLHAISELKGWSIGLISSAVTFSYLVGAIASFWVGSLIDRLGPRPVMAAGAVVMAAGVFAIGHVSEPWHVYVAFIVTGLGNSCLSVTAITATLSPWFERHQGRAVSTAMLGASVGGMTAVPILLAGFGLLGFRTAMTIAALVMLAVVLPLALFVIKRNPAELGLLPDGEAHADGNAPKQLTSWTRGQALRTFAFQSVVAAFALGLAVQVGFLTHHVTLAAPTLGATGASFIVSATAVMAFIGRVLLARYADHVDLRITSAAVLFVAALALLALAVYPSAPVMILGSVVYGLTTGNVTTLSPIIVRKEFGAAAFGAIYGVAWMGIGLVTALGPAFFGFLHDAFGGYTIALFIAAALDLIAAFIVLAGGRTIAQLRG